MRRLYRIDYKITFPRELEEQERFKYIQAWNIINAIRLFAESKPKSIVYRIYKIEECPDTE